MIGLLRGTLIEKRPNQVLIDVGGVGYQATIPLSTFAGLSPLHSQVTLLIYTHVREDQLALYGFLTSREKQCFELLISASGVGPSLALKILSGMGVEDLAPAIRSGNLVRLTQIPGVGRKTAERIVVELREKFAAEEAVAGASKPVTRTHPVTVCSYTLKQVVVPVAVRFEVQAEVQERLSQRTLGAK